MEFYFTKVSEGFYRADVPRGVLFSTTEEGIKQKINEEKYRRSKRNVDRDYGHKPAVREPLLRSLMEKHSLI